MQNIKGNFLSTENLIGVDNLYKIKNSHVCIVGLGGVGSWVAEALVRQGVEKLTLIDLDHIVESNINRQIQAFETNIGESKIKALSSRIKNINSTCELVLVEDFLTNENIPSLIKPSMNVVIDAIDKVDVKISLIDFWVSYSIIFFAIKPENGLMSSCNFCKCLQVSCPIRSGLVDNAWPNLM